VGVRLGEPDDHVTLERVDQVRGDVELRLVVHRPGFHGEISAWIADSAWTAFLDALTALERTRAGSATLHPMSPGPPLLTVRIADPLGHATLDGELRTPTTALSFRDLPVDGGSLAGIVRALS